MMKSKKSRIRSKKVKITKKAGKGNKRPLKAPGISSNVEKRSVRDLPLTPSEIAKVTESRQNIKEGKYRDFATVDDVWKFAESD